MQRHPTTFSMLFVLGSLALGANPFWEERKYTDWDEKEVLILMNKSPWAQRMQVRLQNRMSAEAGPDYNHREELLPDGYNEKRPLQSYFEEMETENVDSSHVFTAAKSGLGDRSQEENDNDRSLFSITIRWYALPIQQASIRWEFLKRNKVAVWVEPEEAYAIGLSGLPPDLFPGDQERLNPMSERLRGETYLKLQGRDPIPCQRLAIRRSEVLDVRAAPWRDAVEIYMMFPRTGNHEITLADKQVEFVTRISKLKVNRKFKLKDMVCNGKLEL